MNQYLHNDIYVCILYALNKFIKFGNACQDMSLIFFLLHTEFFFRKYYNLFNRLRTGQRMFCCWDELWTLVPRLKVLSLSLICIQFIPCLLNVATQKMKVAIKDFFSKCDHICSFLRIWSHLLKKSFMENLIFCAVFVEDSTPPMFTCVLGTPSLQLGLDDTYSWILFSCAFSSDSTMSAWVASFFFRFFGTLNLTDSHNDFLQCLHLANVQTKQQDRKMFLNFSVRVFGQEYFRKQTNFRNLSAGN